MNARYYIEWNDVVSFGFVNGNMMSLSHVQSEGLQMCLYFAKEEYNERYFRKKLDKIPLSRTYMHASTEKMIVLGFLQNELEEELYDEIYSCICQYIDKSKEHSFILQPDF